MDDYYLIGIASLSCGAPDYLPDHQKEVPTPYVGNAGPEKIIDHLDVLKKPNQCPMLFSRFH